MPTFTPQPTNFYTRGSTAANAKDTAGLGVNQIDVIANQLLTGGGVKGTTTNASSGGNTGTGTALSQQKAATYKLQTPRSSTNSTILTQPYLPPNSKAQDFAEQSPRQTINEALAAGAASPIDKALEYAAQSPRNKPTINPSLENPANQSTSPSTRYASMPKSTTGGTGASTNDSEIPQGGEYQILGGDGLQNTPQKLNSVSMASATDTELDDRVIIVDQTGLFVQSSPVFEPLKSTGGVLFPYPPTISVGHKANYEMENLLHSNYTTAYYTHSAVDSINIQGRFTAQTDDDARYILSMIHFFRSVTKMFYAGSTNRGTPPPVLYLDGYGQYVFDHIPIVIKDFQYTLPNEVNYMTVDFKGKVCKVPVDLNITLDTMPVYSRNKISKNFSLKGFSSGGALTGSVQPGTNKIGGWI